MFDFRCIFRNSHVERFVELGAPGMVYLHQPMYSRLPFLDFSDEFYSYIIIIIGEVKNCVLLVNFSVQDVPNSTMSVVAAPVSKWCIRLRLQFIQGKPLGLKNPISNIHIHFFALALLIFVNFFRFFASLYNPLLHMRRRLLE